MMDWAEVARIMMRLPYHVDVIVRKDEVPSPRDYCMEPSIGKPRGQVSNWRATLPDGSCLHVLEYRNIYVVHRDRANLNDNIIRHIALDEPSAAIYLLWLPLLELVRILFRVLYRKRLAMSGSPCFAFLSPFNGSKSYLALRVERLERGEGPGEHQ